MDVQETYTAEAEALTAWIIADMKPGEERGDAMPRPARALLGDGQGGLLLPLSRLGRRAAQIRLGDVGPLTPAKARDAAAQAG